MKRIKKDDGSMIVEATIVFPIMFLVIFLMVFLGNAYFQKSRVDSIVVDMAYYGSAQCADPLLKLVQSNNGVPGYKPEYEIQPYRYVFGELGGGGGMNVIEQDVESQIKTRITKLKTGLFDGMKPASPIINAEFNNAFVYSTFDIEVNYKINMPIRLIGMKNYFVFKASSKIEVPVSDTPEFIRNVDMVEDWVESTEGGQSAISKTQEIMGKFAEFIN